MEGLRACVRVLPPAEDQVSTTPLILVRAEKVADWASRPDLGDPRLGGHGYFYQFAMLEKAEELIRDDLRRVRRRVSDEFTCQVAMEARRASILVFRRGRTGPFEFRQDA